MSKVVRKVFFVWQSKREKAWLESMARQGYVLDGMKPFKYTFKEERPMDIVYEFDFQILNKKTEPGYLELFSDWTLVGSYGSWYYFYKIREGNDKDQIYNDVKSKKDMLRRILGFLAIVGFPLYYQILIMFPNMDPSKLVFPSFYFFFRIIVIIFVMLHIYAFINVLLIYRSLDKSIVE